MHPFRFGLQSYNATTAAEWRDKATRAESAGYDAFFLADHYLGPGPALAAANHPIQDVAAVPAAAMAAEATTTINVGFRVLCIDNRNVAVLAKELATLDFLSEGRLIMGLGAGWMKGEYEAMGISFDPPGTRIDRLAETIDVIKAHMADGEIDVSGAHVRVHGYEGVPKPVQRPHPPIMIGGGGRKVLRLAGATSDIVSLNFDNRSGTLGAEGFQTSTAQATAEKIGWIREGAGDRFDDIELEVGAYMTMVTDDGASMAANMGGALGLDAESMLAHPHALIGSVDFICDEIERRRASHGISFFTVGDSVLDAFAPVVERMSGK